MGQIKRLIIIIKKIVKWHIQREKSQKQEEIKGERTTRLQLHRLQLAQQQASLIYTTGPIGMRVNYITEVKFLLTIHLQKK